MQETQEEKVVTWFECTSCGKRKSMVCNKIGLTWFKETETLDNGDVLVKSIGIRCDSCNQQTVPKTVDGTEQVNKWIPEAYRDSRIEMLEDVSGLGAQTFDTIMTWPHDRSLLLYGPPRRGKTRMVCQLLMRYAHEGLGIQFLDSQRFRRGVEEGLRMKYFDDWFDRASKVRVLALDDLGKIKGAEKRVEEELFNLIDKRIANGRPLIVTTNASVDELKARFSTAIAEPLIKRLQENCTSFAVGMRDIESEPELELV